MGSRGTASAYSVPRMGTPTRERGAPSGPAPPHKLTWPADAGKRVCVCSPLQAGRYYIPVLFRGAKGGARGSVWSERTMVHAHTTQGHRPMRCRWGFGCARATREVTHLISSRGCFPSISISRCFSLLWAVNKTGLSKATWPQPRGKQCTNTTRIEEPKVSRPLSPEQTRKPFSRSWPGPTPKTECAGLRVET